MPVDVRFFRTVAGTEPAREYLRSLEKHERQVCGAMLRAVQNYGLDAPGVEKRQLEGKLWELKPAQHHLMYVMIAGPSLVVLHGCKKESRRAKTGDLAAARQRMKQVLDERAGAEKGKEVSRRKA